MLRFQQNSTKAYKASEKKHCQNIRKIIRKHSYNILNFQKLSLRANINVK